MVIKIEIRGGGMGRLVTALFIDRVCEKNVELEMYEQTS